MGPAGEKARPSGLHPTPPNGSPSGSTQVRGHSVALGGRVFFTRGFRGLKEMPQPTTAGFLLFKTEHRL